MQETLQEKEALLEHLLKERDLERAEITKAASQADHAEQALAELKTEYQQYRAEADEKVQRLEPEAGDLKHKKVQVNLITKTLTRY